MPTAELSPLKNGEVVQTDVSREAILPLILHNLFTGSGNWTHLRRAFHFWATSPTRMLWPDGNVYGTDSWMASGNQLSGGDKNDKFYGLWLVCRLPAKWSISSAAMPTIVTRRPSQLRVGFCNRFLNVFPLSLSRQHVQQRWPPERPSALPLPGFWASIPENSPNGQGIGGGGKAENESMNYCSDWVEIQIHLFLLLWYCMISIIITCK